MDPRDVLRRLRLAGRVGGDQDVLVRDQTNRRLHEAALRLDQAQRDKVLDLERCERPRNLCLVDRCAEHEQRRDRPERLPSLEPPKQERHVRGAHQQLAVDVERLAHRRAVVPGRDENLAKLGDETEVGGRERP